MKRFEMTEADIPGLFTIRPRPLLDDRGWFMRSFAADDFASIGFSRGAAVEENHSRSRRRVLRGLHVRCELRESKLVRVARGRIFDVVVDLRPASPTFLQWRSFELDDVSHLQIRVPPGCAHGFQVESDLADVCYKVDAPYDPKLDVALAWNDPEIGVAWPLPRPLLSARDDAAPRLADIRDRLAMWFGEVRFDGAV